MTVRVYFILQMYISTIHLTGVHLTNILRNRRLDLKWIVDQDEERLQQVKEDFYLDDKIGLFSPSDRDRLLSDKTLVKLL